MKVTPATVVALATCTLLVCAALVPLHRHLEIAAAAYSVPVNQNVQTLRVHQVMNWYRHRLQ